MVRLRVKVLARVYIKVRVEFWFRVMIGIRVGLFVG